MRRSPRPTRPRSWCSWARPKRSACSITITLASGTSTPTSITVVATSRRIVAARRTRPSRHPCRRAGIRPWTRPTASPNRACSMAMALLGGRQIALLLGSPTSGQTQYSRSPRAERRARPRARIASMPGERHDARVDRLAAGRLLAQLRDLHVAVERQHQGARDRRRGHHQQIGRCALGRERQPLMDAEAVLLVDHRQRQIGEGDLVLEQGVGADRQPGPPLARPASRRRRARRRARGR